MTVIDRAGRTRHASGTPAGVGGRFAPHPKAPAADLTPLRTRGLAAAARRRDLARSHARIEAPHARSIRYSPVDGGLVPTHILGRAGAWIEWSFAAPIAAPDARHAVAGIRTDAEGRVELNLYPNPDERLAELSEALSNEADTAERARLGAMGLATAAAIHLPRASSMRVEPDGAERRPAVSAFLDGFGAPVDLDPDELAAFVADADEFDVALSGHPSVGYDLATSDGRIYFSALS